MNPTAQFYFRVTADQTLLRKPLILLPFLFVLTCGSILCPQNLTVTSLFSILIRKVSSYHDLNVAVTLCHYYEKITVLS